MKSIGPITDGKFGWFGSVSGVEVAVNVEPISRLDGNEIWMSDGHLEVKIPEVHSVSVCKFLKKITD
jgi:hypothetical protein